MVNAEENAKPVIKKGKQQDAKKLDVENALNDVKKQGKVNVKKQNVEGDDK